MPLHLIYKKTPAGAEEMRTYAAGLHPQTRRVLILTDGITSVERIAAYVRGAQVEPLIEDLVQRGFIEPTGPTKSADDASASLMQKPAEFPGPTPAQMDAIREVVLYAVHSMIGFSATQLELQILECDDASDMRQIVGEIRNIMDRQLGGDVGDRFIAAVRAASQAAR